MVVRWGREELDTGAVGGEWKLKGEGREKKTGKVKDIENEKKNVKRKMMW